MAPLLAAMLITSSVSNSSTGGLSTQSGDSQSSSYSSVSEQTYMGNEGGTSTIEIETGINGKVSKQVITRTIPPGGSAEVNIATSSGGGRANVRVHADLGSDGVQSATTSSSSAQMILPKASFGLSIQAFFRSFFDFWHFW